MDTIKTTALTFIAILASVMLLLTMEPQQNETLVQAPAPIYQDHSIQFEPTQIVAPNQPALVERDLANKAFVISTPEQTTPEPFVLYPELEQIIGQAEGDTCHIHQRY